MLGVYIALMQVYIGVVLAAHIGVMFCLIYCYVGVYAGDIPVCFGVL